MSAKFDIFKDKSDKFRFRLKAGNGEVVASCSQGYDSKATCKKAIESVKNSSAEAKIVEVDK